MALPLTMLPSEDIYWTSTEARLLFMPTIDEADSKEAVDNQILLLEEALSTPFSYLNVVEFLGDVTDVVKQRG